MHNIAVWIQNLDEDAILLFCFFFLVGQRTLECVIYALMPSCEIRFFLFGNYL